jgi:hypothetical protein
MIVSCTLPVAINGRTPSSGTRVRLHISAAGGEGVKPHEVQGRAWRHGIGIEGDLNNPGAELSPGMFTILVLCLHSLTGHEDRKSQRPED